MLCLASVLYALLVGHEAVYTSHSSHTPSQFFLPSRTQVYKRTHILGLFICLLISNLIQATGTAMNIQWVIGGGVWDGGFCAAQGKFSSRAISLRASDHTQVRSSRQETSATQSGPFSDSLPISSPSHLLFQDVWHCRASLLPSLPQVQVITASLLGHNSCRMGSGPHIRPHWSTCHRGSQKGTLLWSFRQLVNPAPPFTLTAILPIQSTRCWITDEYPQAQTFLEYFFVRHIDHIPHIRAHLPPGIPVRWRKLHFVHHYPSSSPREPTHPRWQTSLAFRPAG